MKNYFYSKRIEMIKRLRIGATIGFDSSLFSTVSIASKAGIKTFQTCVGQHLPYTTSEEKFNVINACLADDISFYFHCSLQTNLASSNGSVAKNTLYHIEQSLNYLHYFPGGFVQHIGKGENISSVAELINTIKIPSSIFPRIKFSLLMENASGEGTELGTSFDELRLFFEKIDRSKVGLCFDTQHAFAYGLTTWEDEKEVIKVFEEADHTCPKGISLFHLNDSLTQFKSHVDRHANIGTGYIWSSDKSKEGLKKLLEMAKEKEIDMVLETDSNDLVTIYKMMEK